MAEAPFVSKRRVRACPSCDLVVALPRLEEGHVARCPRCSTILAERHRFSALQVISWCVTALILLALTLTFEFVSFSTQGIGERIYLVDTMQSMLGRGEVAITLVLTLTLLVLPACYLIGLIYLHVGVWRLQNAKAARPWWGLRTLTRWAYIAKPWLMADVFLIGALVGLVKVAASAEVYFGTGFWTYGAFALVLLEVRRQFNRDGLWFALAGELAAPKGLVLGESALAQNMIGCPDCAALNQLQDEQPYCGRCGRHLERWNERRHRLTAALLIAAMLLYIPASIFPIMVTVDTSGALHSTIVGGVVTLWEDGSEPVAAIVFIASVIVPVAKIVALWWLLWTTKQYGTRVPNRAPGYKATTDKARMTLYRITDWIGRWSMMDVFVVALLVALVQAGQLMSVFPGPAAGAFAAVVILTMLAAFSFDTRFLWNPQTNLRMRPLAAETKAHEA